jgi:hypothetical protein
MPNDEHVAMLAHGVTVWNEWQAKHDEVPDLSQAGLRGLDLSGFDLSRADLRGADLRGTNLSGANLSGAHLGGANFFKAVLDGADLAGAFFEWSPILELRSCLWRSYSKPETIRIGLGSLRRSSAVPRPAASEALITMGCRRSLSDR